MSFKISDICKINSNTLSKSDNFQYINYLDTGNLTEGRIDELQKFVVGKDKLPSRAKRKVKVNDVLISTVRPNQKHYGILKYKSMKKNMIVSTGFTVLSPNNEIVDSSYLYNYLIQEEITQTLQAIAETSTTAYPSIKPSDIGNLEINLPPIEEQKAIANILSTLDDKIEVNNKINQKLEEMVQAIFKQWFIDFDFPNEEGKPYKSSGGEMVESELGMIPKGWEVGIFRNYISDILGGDWGKENPQGNYTKEVQCIRGADIPEISKGNYGKSPIRFILEKNFNNKQLTEGNLIAEISGGSSTQSTGRITYINSSVLKKFDRDIVCTNFCRAITLDNIKLMEFVYAYWTYLYRLDVFFQFENGTTGIKNFDINSFIDRNLIVNPDIELIYKYHDFVKDLLKKIQGNGMENERLTKLRNMILPKLMSGEIRVLQNK